jgi:hypothetical protein
VTLKFPDDTRLARIVVMISGPVSRLHVRHVASDWVIFTTPHGPDLKAEVKKLRRRAERDGYTVEPGFTVEDRKSKIGATLKS